VLCGVLAAAAAFELSRHQTKQYVATASLVFSDNQLVQQAAGLPPTSNASQGQQATDVQLVQLGDTAARTARLLDHGLTAGEVRGSLSVAAAGLTSIVNVSATWSSPTLAAAIANTYGEQFVKEQQSGSQRVASAALAVVKRQLARLSPQRRSGPVGLALQNRAQSLAILAGVQSGDVQLAQTASVPVSPSAPNVAKNTLVGAVLGLLLGVGIAFWLESLDRTILDPEELRAIYEQPLLGVIPKSRPLSRAARRRGGPGAAPPGAREPWLTIPAKDAEAFRMVRAHLRYRNVDRDLRTVLVVSPLGGEGKTTVAAYLAAAAATVGARSLLLEADLRHPTISNWMHTQPRPGLTDVLVGRASLAESIQSIQAVDVGGRSSDTPSTFGVDLLVAGSPHPHPGELIESGAMRSILTQVRANYDVIVIDSPALTSVADAFPLLTLVDGVVIVARLGLHRRDVAEQFRDTLAASGAHLVGVVANGFKAPPQARYAHGYAGAEEVLPPIGARNGASSNHPESTRVRL
jgi:capsular exopolysaccharide synthesis family protein